MANATYYGNGSEMTAPDYARYDRIWQRVAPAMNPYPEIRAAGGENAAVQSTAAAAQQESGAMTAEERARELALPGAQADPCCMGSEAQNMVTVLEGFAQEEAADEVTYRQIARMAPNRMAAAALRELGRMAGMRAKELAAVHYLITDEEKRSTAAAVVLPQMSYRALLRERYHAAACNGLNYARAEESTMDPCLKRLLQRFSAENYAAADRLLRLLMQLQ